MPAGVTAAFRGRGAELSSVTWVRRLESNAGSTRVYTRPVSPSAVLATALPAFATQADGRTTMTSQIEFDRKDRLDRRDHQIADVVPLPPPRRLTNRGRTADRKPRAARTTLGSLDRLHTKADRVELM